METNPVPEFENNKSLPSNNASTFNFHRQLEPGNTTSEKTPVINQQNSKEKNADALLNDEYFIDPLMRNSASNFTDQIDYTPANQNIQNSDQSNSLIEINDSDKEHHQNLKSSALDTDGKCTPVLIDLTKEDQNKVFDDSTSECAMSVTSSNDLKNPDTNGVQYTEIDGSSSNENSGTICEIEIIDSVAGDSQNIAVNKEHTLMDNFSKDEYRCESDVWTDDEDSSSSDSSSSDSETFFQAMQDNFDRTKSKKIIPVKTKGELGLDDLPPIEELKISVEENEMTVMGKIHAIVETLVVIRSLKGIQALDLDSVLFLFHDKPLGRIFDVFGPVNEPFYSIRFNSVDQINEKGVQVGDDVYFAPEKRDITLYVFVEDLQKQKGSDASWKDNNEPPVEFLDYSDDEEERKSKRERIMKNRNEQFSKNYDAPAKKALLSDDSSTVKYIRPPKLASGQQSNVRQFTQRFPNPNPFLSRMPPPSPSVSNLFSPVRVQQSFYPPPSQPRQPALVHPQNILRRPPPTIFHSPYQQQPPIFGQIAVLNPLPSPTLPTLIPASSFTPPPAQNCFRQEFARSPSPGFQVQRFPSDFQFTSRPFSSSNVHPSHPLTIQIPSANDSSYLRHPLQDRHPQHQQQFMNHQSTNVNGFQIPNASSAPFSVNQYPQVRSPMQQFASFPRPNFNNPFLSNVSFPPGNGQPTFYR